MHLFKKCLSLAVIMSLNLCFADTIIFRDQDSFLAELAFSQTFTTTADNIALANEDAPSGTLTFDEQNTGLIETFSISSREQGSTLIFNESTGNFENALSIGAIDSFENDDFEINFDDGITAFGFFVNDNDENDGESIGFSAFRRRDDGVFESLEGAAFPTPIGDSGFLGIIATDGFVLTRIRFNEDEGGDDIAVKDFILGEVPVPEPSTYLAMIFGLLAILSATKRKRN